MRYYSTVAVGTTLTGSMTAGDLTFTVAATTGWPTQYPFTLIIDRDTPSEDIVEVTNVAGLTVTCTRSVDGATAVSHDVGATVEHGVTARDFQEPQTHMDTGTNVHGVGSGSEIVGTKTVQTLENKTLTTPVLDTPVIADHTDAGHDHSSVAQGGLLGGGPFLGCFTGSGTSVGGTPTWLRMDFDQEEFKTASGMHSNSSNKSRLIATEDGLYLIQTNITWTAGTGWRFIKVNRNSAGSESGGSTEFSENVLVNSAHTPDITLSWAVDLTAGEYLEIFAAHENATNLTVTGRARLLRIGAV